MLTNQSRSSTVKHGRARMIYQVLHLLLQPCHGLLGAHGKHERVHVLVIQSHLDLLQNETVSGNKHLLKVIKRTCLLV